MEAVSGEGQLIGTFRCQICDGQRLQNLEGYAALPRVTSDCKPYVSGGTLTICNDCGAIQKLPDRKWLEEVDLIYGNYQIYSLSGGAEQVIFSEDGSSQPRSKALIDFIFQVCKLPEEGNLIDIGCGNGAALANFSASLPRWSLFGTELSDASLARLQRLPNFVKLYKETPVDVLGTFELVTMIHSLEHMPNPLAAMQNAAALLAGNGIVFVEVPNVETSPFDLVVADHLMHFSAAHLRFLAHRAGLSVSVLREDVLPKEITLMAKRGSVTPQPPDPGRTLSIATKHVNWLTQIIASARSASHTGAFGIFGTSISAMWLYGAMRDRVSFFVDEDKSRVGQIVEGRPVIPPSETPSGATVFLPLVPAVAKNILKRLDVPSATFVTPPPLSS